MTGFSRTVIHCLGVSTLAGLLLLGLSACQPAAISQWHWEQVESGLPRQATVLSVAADPANPARLWMGYYAPGGLATSHDGGQTWTVGATGLADNPVFDLLAPPPPHEELALSSVSPVLEKNEGTVWAATRDGLLRSVDAGASWQPVRDGLPPATVFTLAADSNGRIYAGLDDAGIYAETEDEPGWESLTLAEPLASAAVLSLVVSPDGQQLYAGTAVQGLFASRDGGRTWVAAFPNAYAPNVALNPADPAQAVASLRDQLVRTRDGGESWHILPVPWAQDEVVSLLWLADGTLGAGTGQGRLYRSVDGGNSWIEGGTGLLAGGAVLTLAATEAQSPGGSRQLLAGTWTGAYASDDGGENWTYLTPELGLPYAQTLLATEAGLLLGARTGLFRWQPETRRWLPAPGNFPPGGVASLAVNPTNGQVLYASTTGDGVYRSEDGGAQWENLPALDVGIPAMAIDPKNPAHLYILAAWERVYESRNSGQNWQARWEGLGMTLETVSLVVDPLEPMVYVGTETGLYRSRNGRPWRSMAPALADQTILALMTQPLPPHLGGGSILYLGTTRGVYRSLDHGHTVQGSDSSGWGRGLEEVSVTAFLLDPANPRRLYAGTAYAGLYQSVDRGETWQPIGPPELADDVVKALAWGPEGELFVAAASGVWAGKEF